MIRSTRSSTVLSHVMVWAGYLVFAVFFTYPLVFRLDSHVPMPTYIHDRPWVHYLWVHLWWLWHTRHFLLAHHVLPLSTTAVFYPVGINCVAYLVQCLFPSVLFMVLWPMARDVVTTGNIMLLWSLASAGYGTFLLARSVIGNDRGAFLAGLAYAFCSPQLGNAQGHLLILTALPVIPLFLLGVIRTMQASRFYPVFFLAFSALLLFLNYWYYMVFAMIMAVFLVIFARPSWKAACRLLLSALLASLAILPLVILVITHKDIGLGSTLGAARNWSVDLLAFVIPAADHPLYGPWVHALRSRFAANPTIQSAYLGYPLLFLALVGVWKTRWDKIICWLTGFVVFAVLSLGPVLHIAGKDTFTISGVTKSIPMPFVFFHHVPVLSAIRDCSMFLVISSLCLAILAGFGTAALVKRSYRPRLIYGLIIAVLVFDLMPLPFPLAPVPHHSLLESLASQESAGSLLNVPLRNDVTLYQFYQTQHHQKILSGNLSRMSPFYARYGDDVALITLFKHPQELVKLPTTKEKNLLGDAAWAQHFFNLRAIVLHKALLSAAELKAAEKFISRYFPILERLEDQSQVIYHLGPVSMPAGSRSLAIDFDDDAPHRYILSGWSQPEHWPGNLSVRWSDQKSSRLFVDMTQGVSYRMTLQLMPFTYPGGPIQEVRVAFNGEQCATLLLAAGRWQEYVVNIPAAKVRRGANRITFTYKYTARPKDVQPPSEDPRQLGVAFDFIRLDPVPGRR